MIRALRALFRLTFRTIRFGLRIGLLAGLGFALVKLVQNRRGASPVGGGSEWSAPSSRRAVAPGRPASDSGLIDPHMLHGVSLKRPEDDQAESEGVLIAPPPPPTAEPSPPPPAEPSAAVPKKAPAKKTPAKKAVAKKAVAVKQTVAKKAAAKKASAAKAVAKEAVAKKAAAKKTPAKKTQG